MTTEVKDCTTCGRIGYCSLQYKGGCLNNLGWIASRRGLSIESVLREAIPDARSKSTKREMVIEDFAKRASIESLSYFTQLLDQSEVLNKILDVLNQFDSISAREFVHLTGFDVKSIYTMLNKLFELEMVIYEVSRGGEMNKFKNVRKWRFNL